ncbi:glycoside hydrolase family 108 protein [Cloacibacillus evryensis]|uniref:glycoside hydrolase family 108 protein n=1 Tax=Cloacibacillus evryensis TaxID=508460 RepID=UPI000240E17D|nr:glycosyl hydrolase 108 family protein [Cloacibacillus evryensis]EHL65472.1 hypothetical protein HMPREF1006_00485 [Synergistes sp. 3_1_syn1]
MSFNRAISFTLKWEGGYVNHPADKGGATNRGITQSTLNAAFNAGLVKHNVIEALSRDEAVAIYKRNFWNRYGWGSFSAPVDMILFDITVNHGIGNTAKIAQRACVSLGQDVAMDGKWGPETRRALLLLEGRDSLALSKMLIIKRLNFYESIVRSRPSQKVFLRGWLRRSSDLAKAAGIKL